LNRDNQISEGRWDNISLNCSRAVPGNDQET
jgi:hypothetical protein